MVREEKKGMVAVFLGGWQVLSTLVSFHVRKAAQWKEGRSRNHTSRPGVGDRGPSSGGFLVSCRHESYGKLLSMPKSINLVSFDPVECV